jgi:hypothetical protein
VVTKAEPQALAEQRVAEADALLRAGFWSAAYYPSG